MRGPCAPHVCSAFVGISPKENLPDGKAFLELRLDLDGLARIVADLKEILEHSQESHLKLHLELSELKNRSSKSSQSHSYTTM